MPYSLPSGAAEAIRAEAFESSLHPRILGRAGSTNAPFWRLIYVEQGNAELIDGAQSYRLEAPSLLLQPWHKEMRMRIAAGAVGVHAQLGSSILASAIGHKPESPELRFMIERRALISLAENRDMERTIAQAISVVLDEGTKSLPAAQTIVEAALRIILVNLWRAQGIPQQVESSVSTTRRLMSQFNNLVEVHFRQRWTLAQYASALGITSDRLNDICRRSRDRTPRQVIASRIGVEARLLLDNSLHSLDQIASELGFPSTAQFNRFFKSIHGLPPGQYRRQQLTRGAIIEQGERPELFEWP